LKNNSTCKNELCAKKVHGKIGLRLICSYYILIRVVTFGPYRRDGKLPLKSTRLSIFGIGSSQYKTWESDDKGTVILPRFEALAFLCSLSRPLVTFFRRR
jgi:hypothetical protein